MKRRVLSTIIALLLVAALLPMSVFAASYTDTDKHFYEIRTGNAKERHTRFSCYCLCKQCLTGSRRAC